MANSAFQFENFKIQRSLIDIKNNEDDDLKIDIDLNGKINKSKKIFLLFMDIKINNNSNSVNIEVSSTGKYSFPETEDLDNHRMFFYVNAPALLFPYVRAYISTLTTISGLKTITLPTLNLTELGPKLKENTIIED
jgi:preprotein translocase subunit SecB